MDVRSSLCAQIPPLTPLLPCAKWAQRLVIIHSKSYPRAGLIGNPSDGYFGKTIAFIVRNFEAEVILYETPVAGFVGRKR